MSDDPIRYWHALTTAEIETMADLDPVVVLPIAAIEQHGPHLPLSTDLDIGLGILTDAFGRLSDDFPVWVLPPIAVGASLEHERFPGTVTVDAELLAGLIDAHASAVARIGARRLVLSNSHGGNRHVLETAALRIRARHGLLVVKSHYFLFPPPPDALPDNEWRHGLHGGMVETAMMLYLRPDAVRQSEATRSPSLGEELEDSLRQVGPAREAASFAWLADDLNLTGVTGDAGLADAQLGQRLVEHYGALLADVIQDAKEFPLERLS